MALGTIRAGIADIIQRLENVLEIRGAAGQDIDYTTSGGGVHRFEGPVTTARIAQTAPQMLHLQHRILGTNNTGTFTAGEWRRRPINYLVQNTIPGASYDLTEGSEIFILPAGLYWLDIYSCAFYVMNNVIRLYDVIADLDVTYGDAGLSNNNSGYNNTGSTIREYLSIEETRTFAVDHISSTSRSNDGFGYKNSLGDIPGIFANYMIWRVD